MAIWSRWFRQAQSTASERIEPRAAVQGSDGGVRISTSQQLDEYLRDGGISASGAAVTPESAMRIGAVFASVRLITGPQANLPLDVKVRVDEKVRQDASDSAVWRVLNRKPNAWQTPQQFRRMLSSHHALRGNGYAMIVWNWDRTQPQALIPMHPDRTEVKQNPDLSLTYRYQRKDGGFIDLRQDDVFHLMGLTFDGVTGVTPITYARESIGLAMTMERHGSTLFKNGARPSVVLRHPKQVGKEAMENLRESLDEYRQGGDSEGRALILEEGMEISPLTMTALDAQWIESRKFSRTEVSMFFGVPPFMLGDTEKSTSWGSGIEQQTLAFIAYTLEDYLTMWEQTAMRDLVRDPTGKTYVRFNRSALVKGDIKTRWDAYVKGMQWGVWSPDDVRGFEDENPRSDGEGGRYYDPPNTAGASAASSTGDQPNDPAQPA